MFVLDIAQTIVWPEQKWAFYWYVWLGLVARWTYKYKEIWVGAVLSAIHDIYISLALNDLFGANYIQLFGCADLQLWAMIFAGKQTHTHTHMSNLWFSASVFHLANNMAFVCLWVFARANKVSNLVSWCLRLVLSVVSFSRANVCDRQTRWY